MLIAVSALFDTQSRWVVCIRGVFISTPFARAGTARACTEIDMLRKLKILLGSHEFWGHVLGGVLAHIFVSLIAYSFHGTFAAIA